MLKKICFLVMISLNLFSNDLISSDIKIDSIFEDIDKKEFKTVKMGFKETFKTKVEFFDWNSNKQFVFPAIDKMINSSMLYGKPETFFITYENNSQDIITYTCQLEEKNCEGCQVVKKELSEESKKINFDCIKIENKHNSNKTIQKID